MMVKTFTPYSLALLLLVPCLSRSVTAQELTPRAYWPAPHGTKFFVLGYAYQSGDIVTDPSLPVSGVDSEIHTGLIAYQQTISLFGRSSNFQRNTRAGITFVFPIKGRHAIKSSVSRGVTTDSGGDFFTLALSYLYLIG